MFKGSVMRLSLFRATVLLSATFAAVGCSSLGMSAEPAANPPATNQDASGKPYDGLMAQLPHDLDGEIRRAQLLRARGDFKESVKALSQLMLVAPDDPRIVGEYGKVLTQIGGRTDDALAFLARAIELQPDNWTFYSAEGVAYDQKGDKTKAESAYQHALALKPDNPSVLNNYAMSQMQAGHLDRAEQLLREAAAHGAEFPKIANNLAMIAEMRGRAAPTSRAEPVKSAPLQDVASTRASGKGASSGAPRSLLPAPVTHSAVASGATRQAPSRVVMQHIPYDPLAGKHYGKAVATATKTPAEPQHLARAEMREQPARAPASKPAAAPALRTAADIY